MKRNKNARPCLRKTYLDIKEKSPRLSVIVPVWLERRPVLSSFRWMKKFDDEIEVVISASGDAAVHLAAHLVLGLREDSR